MNKLTKTTNDFAPAFLLMIMAPLLTEVLPGATRFSSIFVFPIEVCVWAGGALLIRFAVRRWRLGWLNMLLLAFALALAEECIIQQTSLAPMVIRLKGETYGRAWGVNYVYLLWALIYEPVFVVFLSVYLVELIYPSRRERPWISKSGFLAVLPLFVLGGVLAWFSWTQIARPKVFKMPVYNPPLVTAIIALALIGSLLGIALSAGRNNPPQNPASLKPWSPWVLGITGALWAVPLFGLVLLGFGIAPNFPPVIALAGGGLLLGLALYLVPKWTADARWQRMHSFALIAGTILGSMSIGFVGFLGTVGPDLYFKIITNIIAIIGLTLLGIKTSSISNPTYSH